MIIKAAVELSGGGNEKTIVIITLDENLPHFVYCAAERADREAGGMYEFATIAPLEGNRAGCEYGLLFKVPDEDCGEIWLWM